MQNVETEVEKYDSIILKSDQEFLELQERADKRIEHVVLIQDQLRNHISNLESINKVLENRANTTKDPDDRIRTLKSLSYNYDRLIKLYDVYQTYEVVMQRYHTHLTDTVNKKYNLSILALKNNKQDKTSVDFFRKLHSLLTNKTPDEIDDLTSLETQEFDS